MKKNHQSICGTWVAGALVIASLVPVELHAEELFVDTGRLSGLEFEHFNGMSGALYFVEMMGAGGGFFDYDNDGDLDVYLVQGARLERGESQPEHFDQLYRNDLVVHPMAVVSSLLPT